MTTVKNIALAPVDLPDGRLLRPGRVAGDVDVEHPEVCARLDAGALVEVGESTEQTEQTERKPRRRRRPPQQTEQTEQTEQRDENKEIPS